MVSEVRVDNVDDDAEKLLKARFTHDSDKNYLKDGLHIFAENKLVVNKLSFTWQKLMIKIPDNCKYPLEAIHAAQNQKQTNIGDLTKLLTLKC